MAQKVIGPAYEVGVIVGLKKVGKGFTVKLPEKDFQIENEGEQTAFYAYLYNALKEDLSLPWTQKSPKVLGFVPPK
jgi:hypothetical protein